MPRVYPNSVPERMVTKSFSERGVVRRLCPGRLRVSWGWMSASVRALRSMGRGEEESRYIAPLLLSVG